MPVRIILSYAPVLELIQRSLGVKDMELNQRHSDSEELLATLVFSYFSRYDLPMGNETHHRVLHELKEREAVAEFEHSHLALSANLEIIRLTSEHLPGFQSHNTEHINRIMNMEIIHRSDLVLDIDALALPWFGAPAPSFHPQTP